MKSIGHVYFNGMATSNRVNDMDGPPPKRSKPNFDAFKVLLYSRLIFFLFFEFQTLLFSIDLNIVQFVDCSTFCVFTVISIDKNRRRRIKELQVEKKTTENCAAAIGIRHPKRLLKIVLVPFFLLVFLFTNRLPPQPFSLKHHLIIL